MIDFERDIPKRSKVEEMHELLSCILILAWLGGWTLLLVYTMVCNLILK